MAEVISPFSFTNAGGLYSSFAFRAYSLPQRANTRFSEPDRRIFWIPFSTAYVMPVSCALSSIFLREMPIWISVPTMLTITVARITRTDGRTSAGA